MRVKSVNKPKLSLNHQSFHFFIEVAMGQTVGRGSLMRKLNGIIPYDSFPVLYPILLKADGNEIRGDFPSHTQVLLKGPSSQPNFSALSLKKGSVEEGFEGIGSRSLPNKIGPKAHGPFKRVSNVGINGKG